MTKSKVLWKEDEGVKILLMKILGDNHTWWFDLDSIYCVNWEYTVIEFLKCDNTPAKVSHPKFYAWKNKQKWISLWNITQKLWWRLILLNYEMSEWEIWENFKLMLVESLDVEKILALKHSERWEDCIKTKDILLDFEWLKRWWLDLNNKALKQ